MGEHAHGLLDAIDGMVASTLHIAKRAHSVASTPAHQRLRDDVHRVAFSEPHHRYGAPQKPVMVKNGNLVQVKAECCDVLDARPLNQRMRHDMWRVDVVLTLAFARKAGRVVMKGRIE